MARGPSYTDEELRCLDRLSRDGKKTHEEKVDAFFADTGSDRSRDAVSQKLRKMDGITKPAPRGRPPKQATVEAAAHTNGHGANGNGHSGVIKRNKKKAGEVAAPAPTTAPSTLRKLVDRTAEVISIEARGVQITGPMKQVGEVLAQLAS